MNVMPENIIIQTVAGYLRKYDLIRGGERILVAVSGGRDSLALLYILHELKELGQLCSELLCVHLNHQLRGEQADKDALFVQDQTQKLGIPFVTDCLPVKTYAKTQKRSLETAARDLRLKKLQSLAQIHDCQTIATGHHLDDNAETVLFRLLRGTGFRGLAGIHPKIQLKQGLHIVRPLLCLRRTEITTYLQDRNQGWREDHTNQDLAMKRNFIRHRLLPEMQRNNDQSLPRLLHDLATQAYQLQIRIDDDLSPLWLKHTSHNTNRIQLDCQVFQATPPWSQVAWLQKALAAIGCGLQNIDQHHYRQLVQIATDSYSVKKHTLPQGFLAERICNNLVITAPTQKQEPSPPLSCPICVPGITTWGGIKIVAEYIDSPIDLDHYKITKTSELEWLDLDRLEGPLIIRNREPGDRFQPLGTKGRRKVGKFLTDLRLAPAQRSHVAIIADQQGIVWVAPHRLSERVRITEQTQRILQLAFKTA